MYYVPFMGSAYEEKRIIEELRSLVLERYANGLIFKLVAEGKADDDLYRVLLKRCDYSVHDSEAWACVTNVIERYRKRGL